ncbi:flagellar protein FlaG [Pseudomonas sp. GD03944]|uniref:flagellar protein FlaG n=1 Tax=Pseudomonas sp. GD03944 TaxID=2975409 RepID=UPI00244D0470|nr:flagellar protein FlaG [Pseudomonas sp. GD03944]MDH1261753.1 flagellar protein FlaG [Pseudomonas sp. GD03944]
MDVSSIKNSLNPTAAAGTKLDRAPASGKPSDSEAASEQVAGKASETEQGAATTRDQVEAAVATIQDFVQSVRRDINFSLEEGSGRVVVKVTDSGSGDVIRQIPSEEALQLAENLSEVRSLLFKAEA